MWTSKGRWDNGVRRTLTSHMQMDKDGTFCVAAGGTGANRKLTIDGKGNAFITGDRVRMYIFENNYNAVLQLKYRPTSTLDNLSLKLRSRHNEDDPNENRFGGYQSTIRLGRIYISRENYHGGDSIRIGDGSQLQKKMENGKEYDIRYTCKDTPEGWVNLTVEINYPDDGKGFIKVIDKTDKAPLPYMKNKDLYFNKKGKWPSSSYVWIRVNGEGDTDPTDIKIRDVSINPILP